MSQAVKKEAYEWTGWFASHRGAWRNCLSFEFGFHSGRAARCRYIFVLSGYLITDILLSQWREHGRIALGDFG